MNIKEIRIGDTGDTVRLWQEYLHGEGCKIGAIDGVFGPKTEKATRSIEKVAGLVPDGVVDNELWQLALSRGLQVTPSRTVKSVPLPSFKPLSVAQKHKKFGRIESVPAPTASNPEAIRITNGWQRENLVKVAVPDLVGITGAPTSGLIFVNKVIADPIVELFYTWDREGLIRLVKTWAGSWVPRYVRRAPGVLSSHAWGTAFDINAAWNGLGRTPADCDAKGTVIPLVEIANNLGFWWGGHWKRPDGMHFEYVGK